MSDATAPEPGVRRLRRAVPVPADVVRRARAAAGLGRLTRVLAGTQAEDGTWLLGTRDLLIVLPQVGEAVVLPWERVEAADWDLEQQRLRVRETGAYGESHPERTFAVTDPGLLLELLRERVTASIVLQRHTAVQGKAGVTVIARRAPRGGELRWMFSFDEGIDPVDPAVRAVADAALATACAEVGVNPTRI
ncbi:hypothetical protein [Nocardioides massiliensis]|uniref:Uncharacterized protein n=1 Tax=Nocardioides massiliensis TaxID=1325935 RepID=A0ABT9NQ85_9ACTN|nr:hypothetical protein [Nocardioides massiliensis]MDP9822466.1 hypothetical protein [Nocardioides massiliensis]